MLVLWSDRCLMVLPLISVGRPSVRYDLLWPSTITGKSGFDARVEEVLKNSPRSATKSGVLLLSSISPCLTMIQ
jgi:hypothetical protein